MFKVKYVDSIMMLVRLDLNLIVSLFQHKCEVSETVSTTTLENTIEIFLYRVWAQLRNGVPSSIISRRNWRTVQTQQCTTTTSLLQKQNWKTWVRKFSISCRPIKDRIAFKVLLCVFHLLYGISPGYIHDIITKYQPTSVYTFTPIDCPTYTSFLGSPFFLQCCSRTLNQSSFSISP